MRNLLSINLLFILFLTGCVSIKPKEIRYSGVKPDTNYLFPDFQGSSLYRATLNIKKHRLTGLLLIKRMDSIPPETPEPEKVYRIVFTNEVGLTFWDFELTRDSMRLISCFESLNKKPLIKILKSDFRLLTNIGGFRPQKVLRQDSTNNLVVFGKSKTMKIWRVYSPGADTLTMVTGKSTFADQVSITFSHNSKGSPSKIVLVNPLIGMKLTLRKLN